MRQILAITLAILLVGCSSKPLAKFDVNQNPKTIVAANKYDLGEVLNHSYFFEQANKDQSYTLYIPNSYDESQSYPLIILLHGLRSNPNQIINYKGIIPEAEKRGYIIAAPYGYNERGWYGSRGKGKDGIAFGKADDPENLGELSEMDVMNVLEIVKKDLSIDPQRIFLLGHSMGGGGALHLAATYPQIWTGLACLAPSFNGKYSSLDGLKNLPVYVVTGDKDRLVPVRKVRRLVEEMKQLNMDVVYQEIKGGRHFRTITHNPEMIAEVFDFFDQNQ
jgi:predicted peptidase